MICCVGMWKGIAYFQAYNLIQQLRTDERESHKMPEWNKHTKKHTNAITNILSKRRYRHNNPTKMHAMPSVHVNDVRVVVTDTCAPVSIFVFYLRQRWKSLVIHYTCAQRTPPTSGNRIPVEPIVKLLFCMDVNKFNAMQTFMGIRMFQLILMGAF